MPSEPIEPEVSASNETLKMTIMNDFHIEPDYSTKYSDAKTKHAKDLKLVNFHNNADSVTQGVLHAAIKQAIELYDIFISRTQGTGSDQTDDLVKKWEEFESMQNATALANVLGVFDQIFSSHAERTMFELCDYLDQVKLGETPENLLTTCNVEDGFYGVDAPMGMLNNLLEKMVSNDDIGDIVLLNGDFIAHKHAASASDWSWTIDKKWTENLKIMTDTLSTIRTHLPNATLLPTIGKTDVRIQDQMPCKAKDATKYFGDLLNAWFPESSMPPGMNRTEVQKTFIKGGYYRYDIPSSNMTLLALNGMFFSSKNTCGLGDGADMLDWVEKQVNDTSRQFVLSMNMVPGRDATSANNIAVLWQQNATDRLTEIISAAENIQFLVGGHLHTARISAPKVGNSLFSMMSTPSASSMYGSNPSYTMLEMNDKSVVDERVVSYQLQNHISGISSDFWVESSSKEFRIELGMDKADQTNYDLKHLQTAKFGSYIGLNLGYDRLYRELFLSKAYSRYIAANPEFPKQWLCATQNWAKVDYEACSGVQMEVVEESNEQFLE